MKQNTQEYEIGTYEAYLHSLTVAMPTISFDFLSELVILCQQLSILLDKRGHVTLETGHLVCEFCDLSLLVSDHGELSG